METKDHKEVFRFYFTCMSLAETYMLFTALTQHHNFCQFMHSLKIKPVIFELLAQCLTVLTLRARFTKQGKLASEHNPIKA